MKKSYCSFQTKRLTVRPLFKKDYRAWKKAVEGTLPSQNEYDCFNREQVEPTYVNFRKTLACDTNGISQGVTINLYAFAKKSGELIGGGQYWLIQRGSCQRATIGYWIINNHWKKGYGFELAQGMLSHGIFDLRLNRLEAEILTTNLASIELCKKLGMTSEGIRRESLFEDGNWRDHVIFALTASDLGVSNREPDRYFKSLV